MPEELHPIRRGLDAARKVAPAGAMLVCVALAILIGYYHVPPVTRVLDAVADIKLRGGIWFAIISTAIVGGTIPILVQQAMPATRTRRVWGKIPYLTLFWAYKGAEVDLLYRAQAWAFGDDTAPTTVLLKVAFDQLLYAPIWALPSTVFCIALPDAGYSVPRLYRQIGDHWYARWIVPVLLVNWCVWGPAVVVIYCLPLSLQLPIQNVVLCLWGILLLVMVRQPITRPVEPIEAAAGEAPGV